jgi:L-threonylcarbamoyladenylate synthase
MGGQQIVDQAVAALRAGQPIVLPTDTVYGLCAYAYRSDPARRLSRLKRRDESQPIALVASEVDMLLECVPELRGRAATQARALLPGALTLILPNPGRRFPWLAGSRPDTIGVRVPVVAGPARSVLDAVGALAATSANLTGEPDPKTLDDVPAEILSACGAVVDGGELPGEPSTVVDLTGPEPEILREGAVPAEDVLDRLAERVSP